VENQLVSGEVKSVAEAIFCLDHDCGRNFSALSMGCARFGGTPKAPGSGGRRGVSRDKAHRPSH
jgi:hypothetical protein